MTVDGKTYTDKKEAGVALLSSITLKASTDKYAPVGRFAGFTLYAAKDGVEYSGIIKGQSSYKFNVYMSNTTQMINKICSTVADLETRLKAWKDELSRTKTDLAAQKEMAAEPFAKQDELDKKLARFNEVMKILNPQDEQQIADGEDKTISHGGKDKKSVLLCKISIKLLKKLRSLMQKHLSMDAEKKSVYTAFMHNFYAPICIDENNCIAKIAGDESYSPGMDGTNKKFYHVRAIEIETAPSVGIGNGHTPIMESTASNVTISEVYSLVKQFDKDFMQGGIKSLPYCSTPTQGRFGKQSQTFKTEDSEVIRRQSRASIISNRETSS